jgi:hypothetical protein
MRGRGKNWLKTSIYLSQEVVEIKTNICPRNELIMSNGNQQVN